jgi:tetratricopeptide (TPR) repeat protein
MSESRTFRLFVSSTFSDFAGEREVLQTRVFPEVRRYCSAHGGLSFQPIDLRWGVSEEAQLDQKTLELCLNEVRTCKSFPAPNFLILAGDRYGWVPLPYAIERGEFERVRACVTGDDLVLLDDWYELDANQIPESFLIRERSGAFADPSVWAVTEDRLRTILQSAATAAGLSREERARYVTSATEAEVIEGVLEYGGGATSYQRQLLDRGLLGVGVDPKNVFAFLRTIESDATDSVYLDADRKEARGFKERIREAVCQRHEVTTSLDTTGEPDGTYLEAFGDAVLSFLTSRVDAHIAGIETITEDEREKRSQHEFLETKRTNFQGRGQSREVIASYLAGSTHPEITESDAPLVVSGPSGRGKSALMAQAMHEAAAAGERRIVWRFVGATPASSSTTEILTGILADLDAELPPADTDGDERESFTDFCERARDAIWALGKRDELIAIFIDAVDQLDNDDAFLWIPSRLPNNVKLVISALDDPNYRDDSQYLATLRQHSINEHMVPEFEDPRALLRSVLAGYGRMLQPHQEEYVLRQYASSGSPFFLQLAAEELRHWRSSDAMADEAVPPEGVRVQDLAGSQQDLVREFIDNLKQFYHHNDRFVSRVLGFLHASRDGLSERELLELISVDREFVREMAPDTWHRNVTGELPTVIWSRLALQLRPFLRETISGGELLLTFFHREFADAVGQAPGQQAEHEAALEACEKLIIETYQYQPFEETRWGKIWTILATEYRMRYPEARRDEEIARFVLGIEDEYWLSEMIMLLQSELNSLELRSRSTIAKAVARTLKAITTPLYERIPALWADDYTDAIGAYARSLVEESDFDNAILLQEESMSIRKHLYESESQGWTQRELLYMYVDSLLALSGSYRQTDRTEEARKMVLTGIKALGAELERIRSRTDEKTPHDLDDLSLIKMGMLAESWGVSELGLGNADRAETFLELAVHFLSNSGSERATRAYVGAVNNLARVYLQTERPEVALEHAEEGFSTILGFQGLNPERWRSEYAASLDLLVTINDVLKRAERAAALELEHITQLRSLVADSPDRWVEVYLKTLDRSMRRCDSLGNADCVKEYAEESVGIIRTLYASRPQRWANDYTEALINLALVYDYYDRTAEALALNEESIGIIRENLDLTDGKIMNQYWRVLNRMRSELRLLGEYERASEITKELRESRGALR